jgi:hypothetical protein
MYLRGARDGGRTWLAGVVLIAITAILFGVFMGLTSVLVFPTLATQAPQLVKDGPPPSFFALFIVGVLANFFGALPMGIPMLTKRIYPRWCGVTLLIEAVLALLGFVANGPNSSGLVSQIVNIVSPLPLFVVLIWAGYELWSPRQALPQVAEAGTRFSEGAA